MDRMQLDQDSELLEHSVRFMNNESGQPSNSSYDRQHNT